MATKKFKCKVCGYVHEGDSAPSACPLCKAPATEFELIDEGGEQPKKRGLFADKNSNAYIIIYTVVMVVVVAALLTFAATSLKERQDANAENEKKMAVMTALGVEEESFDDTIIPALIVGGEFVPQTDPTGAYAAKPVLDKLSDLKSLAVATDELPIFKYENGDRVMYVIPVAGKGLWGDIWGYVALENDGNTIAGVVFDHKSETPGLGAEIATEAHQSLYRGKEIFDSENNLVSVTLRKGGADKSDKHAVDAITGGTKTSNGVTDMLKNSLSKYEGFLRSLAGAAAEDTSLAAEPADEPAPVEAAAADGANVESQNEEEE